MARGSQARRTNRSDPEAGKEAQAKAQGRRQSDMGDVIAKTPGLPVEDTEPRRGKSGGRGGKSAGRGGRNRR